MTLAVGVEVAVPVAVGVPVLGRDRGRGGSRRRGDSRAVIVLVGAGVAAGPLPTSIACAVKTEKLEEFAVAGKADDAVPANGAARSAKARVKPSFDDPRLKRCVSAFDKLKIGALEACEP